MSDLLELFARDPMSYNDQDLDKIVEELRKMRRSFNTASVAAKAPTKAKATAKTKAAAPALDIDIEL